jgi:CRP-like cAMP-binding protein
MIPPTLQQCAEQRRFDAGATLFRPGEMPRSMFYVLCGEIRLVRRERNGMEVILQRSLSGFFAEASLEAEHYHCDAVAARTSLVLCIPIQAFRDALEADRVFRQTWMALLAREVRTLRAKCERLCLNGAKDRILHYIESEGEAGMVQLKQTRKAWATELGLTHETLYRTLHRLQQQGIIRIEANRIKLIGS